jgi:hypothetical protein
VIEAKPAPFRGVLRRSDKPSDQEVMGDDQLVTSFITVYGTGELF